MDKRVVSPGPGDILIGENGERLVPPRGWVFLPAGDAGVTRRVTAEGRFWRVQFKKGRRMISKGIWAPEETVIKAKNGMEELRATDGYRKKLESGRKRRENEQQVYELEFFDAVRRFLSFSEKFRNLEEKMARAVTEHAVPVNSGTVARTKMIPIEERASRAVIAWMRHRTTGYEAMVIPRIKGRRREVRRMLAERSRELLRSYRKGEAAAAGCPLWKALEPH